MDVYIQAAQQISVQAPLSEAWFDRPATFDKVYVRATEPDYRQYLPPAKLRRMGALLRRAVVCSQVAVQAADALPDAIISGTGLGCVENTEKFLIAMVNEGEEFLQPTAFMQSTHNTISSQIAIELNCHGYNSTYSHKGVSFESALLDAFMQIGGGRAGTALVGGFDEMTANYQLMLGRLGYWRINGSGVTLRPGAEPFAGETSVSIFLGGNNRRALCRLAGVELLFRPSPEALAAALQRLTTAAGCTPAGIDAVICGMNGHPVEDRAYRERLNALLPDVPVATYKQHFGESYTAAGLAVYAGAVCLQRGVVPAHLANAPAITGVRRLLLYHQYEDTNFSLILLTK
jgi:3-oxoacyl-(acyl-carrier-protein) synthase